MPWHKNQQGFSLVELVSIIVIVGILAFTFMPDLRVSNTSLLTSRDAIITAASHAQQMAMARSQGQSISLIISPTSIEVQDDGVTASAGVKYPITLPRGVQITSGTGTLLYDKLGGTTGAIITLNHGQASVTVEASGYAH